VGVGGMQLYKAEVPTPVPDKLRPRIRDTAMILWKVYALLTGAQVVALLLCGVAASCGSDPEPTPAPPADPLPSPVEVPDDAPMVLVLGDSIGAGLGLPEHQAFPAVLQRHLTAAGTPFRLINASESGRTTAGGVSALDWTLSREPDVVVIELGGNDGLRGIPLDEVERNLRTMIRRAREAGARVLLLGVEVPESFGAYGRELAALYPTLAAELEVALVPSFLAQVGLVPEYTLPDGLHPNARGHEVLAETVEAGLVGVLEGLAEAGE